MLQDDDRVGRPPKTQQVDRPLADIGMALRSAPSQADQRWTARLALAHNYELTELWRQLENYDGAGGCRICI
ncbi:hypothetical protein [Amycolatopsis sp. NPDC049159]|uniref:hypothetical protein n=1 Tax=Amycolatopsis sp. NPDC049159 TaxID=3157210 RepID=UPI0033F130F7